MKASWYACSVILVVKAKTGRQRIYPIEENVYLVRAKSFSEAKKKAEALGRQQADQDLLWNGREARLEYGGVRKAVQCSARIDLPGDSTVRRLHEGVEATYSNLVVKSRSALEKLISGEAVPVVYEE